MPADIASNYAKGRSLTWYQLSSCTFSIEVQTNPTFLGDSGDRKLFAIELDDELHNPIISDCSVFPSEDEVLLEPSTRVEVLSVFPAGNGLTIIQMKQLKPRDPIIPYGNCGECIS